MTAIEFENVGKQSSPGKLPVGIQDFDKLRSEGFLYIDKTARIFDMVSGGCHYFLSRPRRFGKSLLVSTLKAFFEGRKDLFEGLDIYSLESEWHCHPQIGWMDR